MPSRYNDDVRSSEVCREQKRALTGTTVTADRYQRVSQCRKLDCCLWGEILMLSIPKHCLLLTVSACGFSVLRGATLARCVSCCLCRPANSKRRNCALRSPRETNRETRNGEYFTAQGTSNQSPLKVLPSGSEERKNIRNRRWNQKSKSLSS